MRTTAPQRVAAGLLAAALLIASISVAAPRRADPDDVDRLGLAATLIADGHPDRATAVLAEVDPAEEGLDLGRYHTLRGLLEAMAGRHATAVEAYRAAIATPNVDPIVHVHLARSLLMTGDPAGALTALDRAGTAGADLASTWLLRGRALLATERPREAFQALDDGMRRFPQDAALRREQVGLLVSLGLFQVAREVAQPLLTRADATADDWLSFADAARRAGGSDAAVNLLEEARLRFPGRIDVDKQLARAHLDAGRPLAAARILAVAAETDPALRATTAEALRQAGRIDEALRHNALVADPAERTRQRLGLYLEAEDWARAASLEDRVRRAGLDRSDEVRYGLAFAWVQLGDDGAAERWLAGIADPKVFEDATRLREAMARPGEP